jgi:pyrimidine-nucleoside phosphorylase
MLHSGEMWRLGDEFPGLVDKHSTGGVGDKTSLVIAPLLAACGVPVVMLTGRALGHTGGTADKLETIPGLRLAVDRGRTAQLINEHGLAIGVATEGIAPADKIFYRLRDLTGTVPSLTLVTASILSKKLATGAQAIVFDVKTGDGAIFPDRAVGRSLAQRMVAVCAELDCRASALLTDMSQPLGRWAGGACEVNESLEILAGGGDDRLRELCLDLCEEAARLSAAELSRDQLAAALDDGSAQEKFFAWAAAQGAEASWLASPTLPLAGREKVLAAPGDGVVSRIATRELGWILSEAAALSGQESIAPDVALRMNVRLGDVVSAGDELARLFLVRDDPSLVERAQGCFTLSEDGSAPPLIHERVAHV